MRRPATLIGLALVLASLIVSVATAATPKKWYWSESRADALVAAKVRIPYCNVYPDDARCPGMRVSIALDSADCIGASEYRSSFTYRRFTCKVVTYGGNAEGRIAVYVIGPAMFHWKII